MAGALVLASGLPYSSGLLCSLAPRFLTAQIPRRPEQTR
jgi:hypothetical protein